MSILLQQLVTHPHLRPYLYGDEALPSEAAEPVLREQITALAAQYVDFFDALILQQQLGNISDHEYSTVWRRFIRHMLVSSTAIRDYCLDHPNWYSPGLVNLAREAHALRSEDEAAE